MNLAPRAIGLLLAGTVWATAETRTWTFETSGKQLEAEVAGFQGSAVSLKPAGGKTMLVPIEYLIASDRAYLVAARAKQWKEVEIVKLDSLEAAGRYKKCSVHGSSVSGEIFVERLPPAVEAILNNRNQQSAQITNLTEQIAGENQAIRDTKAALPAGASRSRAYRPAVRAQQSQLTLEGNDLQSAKLKLAGLQKSYDDYMHKTKDQTVVKMRNTGTEHRGLPVWECLDPKKRN